ncbi:hypothetical protein cce_1637 [Crocosphaera subtropica ATCC 51142]|uniref:Uncharacterized protein n=1 Tax=Crocosphaera subtropica (strain ATCC 51142 / BH68) TaxID=43989 RepID=B1WY00_CROS5|nr:hypothetical protein cce_1637 [Crocosphaera subtropica ATCC 51142]
MDLEKTQAKFLIEATMMVAHQRNRRRGRTS